MCFASKRSWSLPPSPLSILILPSRTNDFEIFARKICRLDQLAALCTIINLKREKGRRGRKKKEGNRWNRNPRYVPVLRSHRSRRRHVFTMFAIAVDLRWIRNCERAVERGANDPLLSLSLSSPFSWITDYSHGDDGIIVGSKRWIIEDEWSIIKICNNRGARIVQWMEDGRLFCIAFWKVWKVEWKIIDSYSWRERIAANYEWRMEDYFVSRFGNWKVWKRMQAEWKIIVKGKGCCELWMKDGRLFCTAFWKVWKRMQAEWKIIVTRIRETKGLLRIMAMFKPPFSRFNGWFFVAILEEREWMNLERERKREKFFHEDCYRYRKIIRFKRMKGSAWLERCHCHSSTRFEFYILYFNFNLF